MTRPGVSVIVRTKDRPGLLAEAMQSLREQTFTDFEVVLVNDGGRPVPPAVLANPPGHGVREVETRPPHGRSKALNAGVACAQGDLLAFLDDDDLYLPSHLEVLTRFLKGSELYGGAYTDARQTLHTLGEDGKYREDGELPLKPRDFDPARLLYANHVPLICLAVRRELALEVGPFDEALDLYEDWDFLIRFSERARLHRLPKVTAVYRVRRDGTNATTNAPWLGPKAQAARAALYEKHRARRTAEAEFAHFDALDHEIRELERERADLRAQLAALRDQHASAQDRLARVEADLAAFRADAARQSEAGAVRERALARERDELLRKLDAITSSTTWKLMTPYWKLKARFQQ